MVKQIKLGTQGLIVPEIGLGCMGMTGMAHMDIYGRANEAEAITTIHRSYELGGNFLDTADLYGPLINEQLVAKAIKGNRDRYLIGTKFGYEIDDTGSLTWKINGKKEYVKKAAERSLKNLGTDYIDLYYLHRVDTTTPIEETLEAMAELVKEGKVRYIGLSEVGSETIRKAHTIHPLTVVQSEYSLFERTIEEQGILATLRELGIGLVAYSPLGRGLLTGVLKSASDLKADDFRTAMPRFQGEQFDKNVEIQRDLEKMAEAKGITPSQLALAWVLSQGVVPIPGTKRIKYVEQNLAAAEVTLTSEDLEQLERIIPLGTATGDRYDETGMQMVNQ